MRPVQPLVSSSLGYRNFPIGRFFKFAQHRGWLRAAFTIPVLQAKLAHDAARADTANDRVIVLRESQRHASGLLLERVRTQMMDVYRPLSAAYCAVDRARAFMARELDFEWARTSAQDTCFMVPSEQLYPHLEVFTLDYAPEFYAHARESQGATAWLKHSPSDIEVRTGGGI